jgi:uncharacterized protein (DUF1330 family)
VKCRRLRASILASAMGSAIFAIPILTQDTAFAASGGNGNYPGMTGKFSVTQKTPDSAARKQQYRQRVKREVEEYAGEQLQSGGRMDTIEGDINRLNKVVNDQKAWAKTTVNSTKEVVEHLIKAPPMTIGVLTAREGEGGTERNFSLSKTGNTLMVTDTDNPQIRYTNMDPTTGEFYSENGFHSRVLTNMKYGQF